MVCSFFSDTKVRFSEHNTKNEACFFSFFYGDIQFHQFHFLQVVDYLAFADETAVSPQFHFRHVMKTISQYHGL